MSNDPLTVWTVDVSRTTVVSRANDAVTLRPKERAVVTAIAFAHPQTATVASIAPLVWGRAIPATANKAIHNHVARLRQHVDGLISTTNEGYQLGPLVNVVETSVDAQAAPFADLADIETVVARRAIVDEQNRAQRDADVEAVIARGDHVAGIPILESLTATHADRPRRWWLLMLAQVRAGRRADALATYAAATTALAVAGRAPGTDLDLLRQHILEDDPVVLSSTYLDRGRVQAVAARSLAGGDPVVIDLPGPMSAIEAAFTAADRPGGRVPSICLVGPAGSGKSTLIKSIVGRAESHGYAVLATHCSPAPTRPLEPFGDLIAQVGERDPRRVGRLANADTLTALVPQMDASTGSTMLHGERSELFDAVADAIVGSTSPTLVIIEDVHCAPPLTAALLAHVNQRRIDAVAPLVILSTARTEPGSTEGLTASVVGLTDQIADEVIELEPWSVSMIAEFLEQFDVSPTWARDAAVWVHAQTGGNPLFVREMALIAANSGGQHGTFVAPDQVPTAVRTAVHHRMSLLSRHALAVVQAAAVLGDRFSGSDVTDMLDAATAGLSEARAIGVIQPSVGQPAGGDDMFEFRHQLYHREVLDGITAAVHAELSDLAARTIAEHSAPGERSGEIARHALAAAAIDLARAIVTTTEAAEQAARVHDHGSAGELFQTAMDVIESHSGRTVQWCDMGLRAGEHLIAHGGTGGVDLLHEVAAAAEEQGFTERWAQAIFEICRLGPTSEAGAVDDRADALVIRALDVITDPASRAIVAGAGTMVHAFSPSSDVSRAHFFEAIDQARVSGRDGIVADILPFTYMSISGPSDLPARERHAEELLGLGAALERPDATWEGLHLQFSNQTQRGAGDLRATLAGLEDAARHLRERSRHWEMTYLRSAMAIFDGNLGEAERLATHSLTYDGAVASSLVFAAYGAHLLAIRLAQGRAAELYEMLQTLSTDQPGVAAWTPALSLAAAMSGDATTAREAFDQATTGRPAALPRDHTYTAALISLGEAAAVVGDTDRIAVAESLLAEVAGRWSWCGTCTFGPVDLTRARLALARGDRVEAQRRAAAVLSSCAQLRAPLYSAHAGDVMIAALEQVT